MPVWTPRTLPAVGGSTGLPRLERGPDLWGASADADGLPWLVAVWFVRDGEAVPMPTRLTHPTGREARLARILLDVAA